MYGAAPSMISYTEWSFVHNIHAAIVSRIRTISSSVNPSICASDKRTQRHAPLVIRSNIYLSAIHIHSRSACLDYGRMVSLGTSTSD